MGRQSEAIINHFSHQHPLHLTNPQPSRICSACMQTLETEPLYTCRSPSCSTVSLHLKYSHLPPRITHPCHHHHLSLLPKSCNPNCGFTCNACGNNIDGFSYNCKDCCVNIHVACATLPLSLSHPTHFHRLSLVFASPYETGGFCCDVCSVIKGSSRCWLYRCGSCGFDAHLSCATSKAQAVAGVPSRTHQEMMFMNQINNQRNQILQAMIMGYGGGNVNNRFMQPMMGGGNMNNQILQALMGGGGGGGGGGGSNKLLQVLMGGGGGGDLIQSLLDGLNGGLGGLDLSSVIGNVGDFGGLMGAGFGGFGF